MPLKEPWSQTKGQIFEKLSTHVLIGSEKLSEIAKNIIKHVTDKQGFPELIRQVVEEIVSVVHNQKPVFLEVVVEEVRELDVKTCG